MWCLSLMTVLLSACGENADFRYSDFHPNLTIDNSLHLDATLASGMNALSPGIFVIVQATNKGGAYYFTFQNNQGLRSEKRFTAIDVRLQNQLHMGMNNGVIVGYGNLDNPSIFFAYDQQCPNCFDYNVLPMKNFPLAFDGYGYATCRHCNRSYNLNTDGNIVKGQGGKPLTRYRAATTGANGILRVN